MNERARAFRRRHAALLAAVLLHAGLLLILPYMINRSEPPPSEPVEVALAPPVPPPKPVRPKPVRPKPAARPAETNSSAGRPRFQPAPRLPHVVLPPIRLTPPTPVLSKPPMSLPAVSGASAVGPPGNGGGGNGAGAGNGSEEGNDYLIRLKAYIDARKGWARYRGPYDAKVALVLDPDGRLIDMHIVSSSGDPQADDEIMTRLRGMSPFPRPPSVLFSASKPLLPVVDEWTWPRS
jgi:TonB family protein